MACWNRNGRSLLATATGHPTDLSFTLGRVVIWDLSTPARPKQIGPLWPPDDDEPRSFLSLDVSRDGQRMAVGSLDGKIHIWDVSDPSGPMLPLHSDGLCGARSTM